MGSTRRGRLSKEREKPPFPAWSPVWPRGRGGFGVWPQIPFPAGRDVGERPPTRRRPAYRRCFPAQSHPEEPSLSPNHRENAIRRSPEKLPTPRVDGGLIREMAKWDTVGGVEVGTGSYRNCPRNGKVCWHQVTRPLHSGSDVCQWPKASGVAKPPMLPSFSCGQANLCWPVYRGDGTIGAAMASTFTGSRLNNHEHAG